MKYFGILFTCSLIALAACSKDASVISSDRITYPKAWEANAHAIFSFSISDTTTPHNIYFNLRTTEAYPFNNLFLITELALPHGKVLGDTLEYAMAYPSGKLMGTGFGKLKENVLIYKENYTFEEVGEYHLKVRHAMRSNNQITPVSPLSGVTDFGYQIMQK
ncbi:MAG: gliding motility lipoprotein GldH [Flavobacteriaceae bacterium]|nr:gliding motility lipoprotein GldH [Flavobacteriaceae bacterium]